MEAHPDYNATIEGAKKAGFEIKFTLGDPFVKVIKVYNPGGDLIRVEKELHLQKGMRYLDLEHELGHIDQLNRFGNEIPPTDKVIEQPNGTRKSWSNRQGILTTWQDIILEYHNRLVEFLRLYERGVDVNLLREHAGGVTYWQNEYWLKGIRKELSTRKTNWANKYFADIKQMAQKYDLAMEIINSGHYSPKEVNHESIVKT